MSNVHVHCFGLVPNAHFMQPCLFCALDKWTRLYPYYIIHPWELEKLRNAVCCFLRNCLVVTIMIPIDSLVQQQQHARHGGVPLRVHVQHGDGHGLRHPELLLAAQKHREPDNCWWAPAEDKKDQIVMILMTFTVVMIMMTIFNSLVSLLCRPTRTLERSKTRKPLKEEDCLADLSCGVWWSDDADHVDVDHNIKLTERSARSKSSADTEYFLVSCGFSRWSSIIIIIFFWSSSFSFDHHDSLGGHDQWWWLPW